MQNERVLTVVNECLRKACAVAKISLRHCTTCAVCMEASIPGIIRLAEFPLYLPMPKNTAHFFLHDLWLSHAMTLHLKLHSTCPNITSLHIRRCDALNTFTCQDFFFQDTWDHIRKRGTLHDIMFEAVDKLWINCGSPYQITWEDVTVYMTWCDLFTFEHNQQVLPSCTAWHWKTTLDDMAWRCRRCIWSVAMFIG